jgi:GNAT superfamily N-acetyltransferase
MDAVVSALSDYSEFLPVVARWHWQEWGHTDPGGTLHSWEAGLARQADADQIPGTLVAVAQGAAVGAVCLVEHDMPGHEAVAGLSPWMKGLFVGQAERRHGYGALLVSGCEGWAAALGHESLYLYTERDSGAEQLYRRLGWQIIDHDQYNGTTVTVMRKNLPSVRLPARPEGNGQQRA